MTLADAVALHRAGDLPAAEQAYRAVLAAGEVPEAMANLASILRGRGEAAEARALLERAAALAPQTAGVWRNLGNLLHHEGDLDGAGRAYEAVLRLAPADDETAFDLARVRLSQGRFAEAWPLFERRPQRARAEARRLSFPEWQGEPLAGRRLFIWPEQGFGDQIMMTRYVAGLDAEATVACLPQMARLLAQLPVTVQPLTERMEVAPHDFWTLPMSLPRWCGPDLAVAPCFTGTPRASGGVGIAWRGNARPDPGRSLPPELGAELLALPGAVSLHPEDSGARDFQDTADLIAGLDLVVSIDTSVAHLAGAMGKPTLVLLQHNPPEWRWLADPAGRSAWHPSAQVLRQPTPGDWRSLIDQVKARIPSPPGRG